MTRTKWLLIGGDSLVGKEIVDLVERRKLPVTLRLATTEVDSRVVSISGEEDFNVMQPLDEELLEGARVVLLCGSAAVNHKALALARRSPQPAAFVDVLGGCEDLPEARLRAPLLESEPAAVSAGVHTLAHPAALALARVLLPVDGAHRLRQACATVFEPASEQGKLGVDELHQQVLSLFSFRPLPQAVFDTQVSFNLLPRRGPEARQSLEATEQRIERHLASLLGQRGTPLPSLRLIQAPVFHAYTLSVWLEFESRPSVTALCRVLAEAGLEVRGADVEPASNVSVAAQSGLAASDIAEDRNCARAMWLWLAFDNVLALAENAVLTAGLLARGLNP